MIKQFFVKPDVSKAIVMSSDPCRRVHGVSYSWESIHPYLKLSAIHRFEPAEWHVAIYFDLHWFEDFGVDPINIDQYSPCEGGIDTLNTLLRSFTWGTYSNPKISENFEKYIETEASVDPKFSNW